jgi:hypothetical protein
MEAKWKGLGLATVAGVAFLMALSGLAAAGGSGYNLSYTQSAGHSSNGAVDLVSVSSSYTSGLNLTVSFSVSGSIDYTSNTTGYIAFFGGSSYANATSYAVFSNGTGAWVSTTPFGGGTMVPTISGGTLSFSMATANLPPPATFSVNVLAYFGLTRTVGSYTWLGTNYNGGGTCTGTGCTTTSGGSAAFNWAYVIIPVIVVVIIVIVVLVLVMRRKGPSAQAGMMGQPGQPMGQPGQPGWTNAPPPPQGQPGWQSPPPPPGA